MPRRHTIPRVTTLIIHPKVRGFICTTTHPLGCELNVRDQIAATRAQGVRNDGPKKVLVIGASSGYGLAARISAAFGFGADTLGVFLAAREEKRVRLNGESQSYDFYPQRRHVEYEFQRIWEEQTKHHPALLTEEARAALHRILFFQRPLKEPEVGVCTFVHSERRLPKAHPLFQERRLYEEVNQLEIAAPGEAPRKLTIDQRDTLILELRGKKEVSFSTLARRLKLQPGESFNKASETRTGLRGNEVFAALADKKLFVRNDKELICVDLAK